MIGFNFRFNPLYRRMRGMIQMRHTGPLIGARTVFTTVAQSRPDWTSAEEEGGGVLLELASHDIDLTRFLFDAEIVRVFAERVSDRDLDTVMIQMGLSNGSSVQGLFSLGSVEESRCEVYGKDCKLSIDRYNSWKVNRQGLHAMGLRVKIRDFFGEIGAFSYGIKKIRSPENEPSYWIALNHFIKGVRSHEHVKPDIEDGFRVMAAISAAEKSIEDGCLKRVEFDA
jgi:predicted dehydrogenase